MTEKKPETFSDIVDRAMGELRSSPVPPELPPELLNALLQAAKANTGAVQCTVEAPAQAEIIRPAFLTRSLRNWRWNMRHPVSRATAAAILVLTIVGVALWFHAGGAAPVYADFLKPILEAKTARYKVTTETMGAGGGKTTTVFMMLGPSRSRSEIEMDETPNNPKSKSVHIWDGNQGKSLQLDPKLKLATVCDDLDGLKDKTPKDADPLGGWRSFFLDVRKAPDWKREPLGEKDIDGRHVIGFRMTTRLSVIDAWGDPKTGMPVRIDETRELMPNLKVKTTMSDFELNVDLDESLFSVEPPAGYKVTIVRQANDGPPGERGLIETFRSYLQFSGFEFPDSLDPRKMAASCSNEVGKELILDMCTPLNRKLDEKKRRKIEEFLQNVTVFSEEYDSEEKKPNKEEKAKREELSHKFEEEFDNLVDWDKIAPGKKNLSKEQKERYRETYTEEFMKKCPKVGIIQGEMWLQPGIEVRKRTSAGSRRALRGQRRFVRCGRQADLLVSPEGLEEVPSHLRGSFGTRGGCGPQRSQRPACTERIWSKK